MDSDGVEVKSEVNGSDLDYDEESDYDLNQKGKYLVKDSIEEKLTSDDDERGYETRSEVASSCGDYSPFKDNVSDVSDVSDITDINRREKRDDQYLLKLNYLFRNARFFLMKSNNMENISLSKIKRAWATLPINRSKLTKAFHTSQNVILIFSAQGSGKFSGFARLASAVNRKLPPVNWVLPPEMSNYLSGLFELDWISRMDLQFSGLQYLLNPWNFNKPVKVGRDGQEIEPKVAEQLCRQFPRDEGIDLTPILQKSRNALKRPKPWWRDNHENHNDYKHVSGSYKSFKNNKDMYNKFNSNNRGRFNHKHHMFNKLFDSMRGLRHRQLPFIPPPPPPPSMFFSSFSTPPLTMAPPRYYEPLTILPELTENISMLYKDTRYNHSRHKDHGKRHKESTYKKYSHHRRGSSSRG